jgi:8-amino-7-oxononanoate synthase
MRDYNGILSSLSDSGNLRQLPEVTHRGNYIERDGTLMVNLSSNDYLGLAAREDLVREFMDSRPYERYPLSSSSSRLLTGNFTIYLELENLLARSFGREAALVFNSGYHANTGILPALADKKSMIIADKLVHASIIDGIKLSGAAFHRYRHNDYRDLRRLVETNVSYDQIFIVTESVFSMDGDIADLPYLVDLKREYPNILLYVDEAHAVGVRGKRGLGLAEETGCIKDIDILVGTFGKALASMGAYVICDKCVREFLVNTMRPLIFSTALPPMQMAWTKFIFERLPEFGREREALAHSSTMLREALQGRGGERSQSHIVPFIVGDSADCVLTAEMLRRKGFYCLPVRPPTVPRGTSRIRFSLTASTPDNEVARLLECIASFNTHES